MAHLSQIEGQRRSYSLERKEFVLKIEAVPDDDFAAAIEEILKEKFSIEIEILDEDELADIDGEGPFFVLVSCMNKAGHDTGAPTVGVGVVAVGASDVRH